jgi:hypothetical protein
VVGCLSENTIQELVARSLSGDARARAHAHIETCAACRSLVIELARDADVEAQVALRAADMAEPAPSAPTATATGTATQGAAEPVGATLGRYRLERELGAGAMGVVHAAFDPNLERRIALKVLRAELTRTLLAIGRDPVALAELAPFGVRALVPVEESLYAAERAALHAAPGSAVMLNTDA